MTNRDEEKAKRLAAALRENLKRRKAQARAGTETSEHSSDLDQSDGVRPGEGRDPDQPL